jgi:Putative transposase/Transposase zinc-binding domain
MKGPRRMFSKHPLKQILKDTIADWDHDGTPQNVRQNFWKIINCGTLALGAEVLASDTQWRIVYHTCKSRFCPSCGARAAALWQEDLEAALPKIPYREINFTMPQVFWAILQQNPRLLPDLPALGAAAIEFLAKARFGAHAILMVVQQTYGGFLNFYPHLHTLTSAGGLKISSGRWIARLNFEKHEIMLAWRYVLLAYLDEAIKSDVLKSDLSKDELRKMLDREGERPWNVFIGRSVSKRMVVDHIGRYIRKPPIAQRRLRRISDEEIEYLAKDTKHQRFSPVKYLKNAFVAILIPHVPDRYHNSMRYFGLLAPRLKNMLSVVFLLLNQKRRARPVPLSWAQLSYRTFGTDPSIDRHGKQMVRVGRLGPENA